MLKEGRIRVDDELHPINMEESSGTFATFLTEGRHALYVSKDKFIIVLMFIDLC